MTKIERRDTNGEKVLKKSKREVPWRERETHGGWLAVGR